MSLANELLRNYLSGGEEFALVNGDREVEAAGYARVKVDRWRFSEGRAETLLRFGPFGVEVSFSATPMMRGREVVELYPLGGRVTLTPGIVYERPVVVALVD